MVGGYARLPFTVQRFGSSDISEQIKVKDYPLSFRFWMVQGKRLPPCFPCFEEFTEERIPLVSLVLKNLQKNVFFPQKNLPKNVFFPQKNFRRITEEFTEEFFEKWVISQRNSQGQRCRCDGADFRCSPSFIRRVIFIVPLFQVNYPPYRRGLNKLMIPLNFVRI